MDEMISVVLPVYNEGEIIEKLILKIKEVMYKLQSQYEIIVIDDGSTDGSFEILRKLAQSDKRIKIIKFGKNFGQALALSAGFQLAQGEIIISMDADYQNDPEDIPLFLEKINQGFDLVCGWRKKRKDPLFTRKLPSNLANFLILLFTGVKLHDFGCTFKAARKWVVKRIKLYGGMHRFIPVFAHLEGAKTCEIEVKHHARKTGISKYGMVRVFKVLLDLWTVKLMTTYATKPIYMFGFPGFVLCFGAVFIAGVVLYQKYRFGIWVHKNPLILLSVFLFLVGILIIMIGLVCEILVRIYFETSQKEPYNISKKINF